MDIRIRAESLLPIRYFLNRQRERGQNPTRPWPPEPDSEPGGQEVRVAIIGMGCRFPDADDPVGLLDVVMTGRRTFRRLPPSRLELADYYSPDRAVPDATYSARAALIEGWQFDRAAFGIPAEVHRVVDPAQWLALEISARALAAAGFAMGEGLPRTRTGVIIGNSLTGDISRAAALRLRWPYVRRVFADALAAGGIPAERALPVLGQAKQRYLAPFPAATDETLTGSMPAAIASRICGYFGFRGGGYAVDGSQASSLLAVASACSALAAGDLDVALAGGVDIGLDPLELVGLAKTGVLARGDMRVYDEKPTGYLPGEGCGMVVLMRSADARAAGLPVYAEIAGWGMSSGQPAAALPDTRSQYLALHRAYQRAQISPGDVQLIEGHGAGTAASDTTELSALAELRSDVRQVAALGSVKANIGNTKAAAGVAGLIKTVLAMSTGYIPPATGFSTPHPMLRGGDAALRLPRAPEPWPDGPRTAAVSAMGPGIDVHLVLRSEPTRGRHERKRRGPAGGPRTASAADISGPPAIGGRSRSVAYLLHAPDRDTMAALLARIARVAPWLSDAELVDLACQLAYDAVSQGRVRVALVASSQDHLARLAGQAASLLPSLPEGLLTLRPGLYAADGADGRVTLLLSDTGGTPDPAASPGDVPLRWALSALRWLGRLGVQATAAAGHGYGEIAGLVWAGCLEEEQALAFAATRAMILNVPPAPDARAQADPAGGAEGVIGHALAIEPPRLLCEAAAATKVVAPQRRLFSAGTGREVCSAADATAVLCADFGGQAGLEEALQGAAVGASLLLETGPGRVMAKAATGACRVPPVSLAGGSGADAAHAAAALFTAGALEKPEAVFTGRPSRPFDIWREPTFITNPCQTVPAQARRTPGPHPRRPAPERKPAAALELPAATALPQLPAPRAITAGVAESPAPQASTASVPALPAPRTSTASVPALPAPRASTTGVPPLPAPPASTASVPELPAPRASTAGTPALPAPRASTAGGPELPNRRANKDAGPRPPAGPSPAGRVPAPRHAEPLPSRAPGRRAAHASPRPAPVEPALAPVGGAGPWVRCYAQQLRPAPSAVPGGDHRDDRPWRVRAATTKTFGVLVRKLFHDDPAADRALAVIGDPASADTAAVALAAARDAVSSGTLVLVTHGPGFTGFCATLHAEHPELGVTVLRVPPSVSGLRAARTFAAAEPGRFSELVIDDAGTVHEAVMAPAETPGSGEFPLGPSDVVLVSRASGGAGLAVAQMLGACGAAVAVIGRETHDAAGLDELRSAGIRIAVEDADLASPDSVRAALRRIVHELGRVTALVHEVAPAGLRPVSELAEDELRAHVTAESACLAGLVDAIGADAAQPLRLIVTFGSVAGRYGLAGAGMLALASGTLAESAERLASGIPGCRALHVDWPAWSQTGPGGPGALSGELARAGVSAIEIPEGSRLLLKALATPGLPARVAVHGRVGVPAPPAVAAAAATMPRGRFLQNIRAHYPGVELVCDATLSLRTDPYLADHRVYGMPTLPATMALEAMAQVAAALTGQPLRQVSHVSMDAPVIVPAHDVDASALIRISALASAGSVTAVLRCAESGFATDHFRATFRLAEDLGDSAPLSLAACMPELDELPASHTGIVDGTELYGPVCFQSGRFRRAALLPEVTAHSCRALVRGGEDGQPWFSGLDSSADAPLLLGSPGLNDATWHVLQACVPHRRLLPAGCEAVRFSGREADGAVEIRAVEIRPETQGLTGQPGPAWSLSEAAEYVWDVEAVDAAGRQLVTWRGLRLADAGPLTRNTAWPPSLLSVYMERSAVGLGLDPMLRVAAHLGQPDGGSGPAPGLGGFALSAREPRGAACGWAATDPGHSAGKHDPGPALADLAAELRRRGEPPPVVTARLTAVAACLGEPGVSAEIPVLADEPGGGDWLVLRAGAALIACTVVEISGVSCPVAVAVMTPDPGPGRAAARLAVAAARR
jgi:enediyne polyketide synthase